MKIYQVTDPEFHKYGHVLEGYDFSELCEVLKTTPMPEQGTIYLPSVPELEALPVCQELTDREYGELPIQIGCCNGYNHLLNAVEYHRCSEVNIPATDMILLLGLQQDIAADYTYDTSKIEAFLVPAGVGVELYATTLHYAPCGVDGQPFYCAAVLSRGTNTPTEQKHCCGEDKLVTAKNKWLIGHPDAGLTGGEFLGLKGENISVE